MGDKIGVADTGSKQAGCSAGGGQVRGRRLLALATLETDIRP
ncbi:hypothetical protein [Kamptonema formosum]|nr:hypothetical protein [Oscillatoria sp. PCC 10802]